MKEYEQKIYNIMGNTREEIISQANQAYKRGYREGYEDGKQATIAESEQITYKDIDDAYNRGLNDAWEVIKKITKDDSVGGYSIEMMQNIFLHTCVYDIVHNYTASEALAKIKEYEDKQIEDEEKDTIKERLADVKKTLGCSYGEMVEAIKELMRY